LLLPVLLQTTSVVEVNYTLFLRGSQEFFVNLMLQFMGKSLVNLEAGSQNKKKI